MSQDRRLNYRVTSTLEREVEVDLVLADGSLVDLVLIDLSAGGVGMAGPAEQVTNMRVGDAIVVRFSSKRLLSPLEIASQVRHIKITDDGIHYGISFDDWGGIRSHMAPKLRSLFNEREAVRVEPRPGEEVSVTILGESPKITAEGWLGDISVLGVGVWATAEDTVAIENGSLIRIQFMLPRTDKVLELGVQLRYQQVVDARARLGLQIVNDQPDRWNGVHRQITQYVMSRQIEIARDDAERRQAMGAESLTDTI